MPIKGKQPRSLPGERSEHSTELRLSATSRTAAAHRSSVPPTERPSPEAGPGPHAARRGAEPADRHGAAVSGGPSPRRPRTPANPASCGASCPRPARPRPAKVTPQGSEAGAGSRPPPAPGAPGAPLPQQLPYGAADAAVTAKVPQRPLQHLHVLRHLGAAPPPLRAAPLPASRSGCVINRPFARRLPALVPPAPRSWLSRRPLVLCGPLR